MSAPEKKKELALLQDVELAEITTADARKYLEAGFQELVRIATTSEDMHMRFHALKGLESYYMTIAAKEFAEGATTKMVRSQDKQTDEVRRLRRKPWDTDGDNDQSEE